MCLPEGCSTDVAGGLRSGRLGRVGEANLGSRGADSATDSVALVGWSDGFGGKADADVADDDVAAGDVTVAGNDDAAVRLPLAEESFASCSSS